MYSHCNSSLYEVQCRLISHYINQQFNMIIKHIGNEIIIHRQLIREGDNHIGLNDNQSGMMRQLINKLNTAKDNSTRKSFFNATNVTLSQTLCL